MPDPEPPSAGPESRDPASDTPHFAGPETPRPAADLQLQNPCSYPESGARRIRPWLSTVLSVLAPAATSFTVRFVSDREMRRLNRSYRHKDSTTDVLSFPGDLETRDTGGSAVPSSDQLPLAGHLGDVAISVPVARRQAEERGHTVERELRFLMLHGLLHCLGYDHETDDGTMELLEQRLRARWIDHG